MLKIISILSILFLANACIPVQIAPKIDGSKIYKGKKFKKSLSKRQVYVFEDPKDANDFYYFINTKFDTDYDIFGGNVPIVINGRNHFLSFYEVERTTSTINLVPLMVDGVIENKGGNKSFENHYTSRSGFWYIALTVSDDQLYDNLKEDYAYRETVLTYLDFLRKEYLSTDNYLDLKFTKANVLIPDR